MADLVKLSAPDDAASLSIDGSEYKVDGGFVSVPGEWVDVLISHGYSLPKPRKTKPDYASA